MGRVRRARSDGIREEPVATFRKRGTGSNLADRGRGAVHDHPPGVVDSEAGFACRWGGHGDSLRRSRGDAAGAKLGAQLIDRFAVNTGTVRCRSRRLDAIWVGGIDASSVEDTGWGGGPVVVGARESLVRGEGGQHVSSRRAGRPGDRR